MNKRVFIVLLLVAVFALSFASAQTPVQPVLPALPQRFVDVTMPNTVGYVTVNVADTGTVTGNRNALQNAINNAACGTIIRLAAGAVFETPGSGPSGGFVLPAKNCAPGNWIIIRSDAPDSSLPPIGVRITPAYSQYLPQILITSANEPGFRTSFSANNYRLMFISIGIKPGKFTDSSGAMIGIDGSYGVTGVQDTSSKQPNNVIVDRVLIRGSDNPPIGFRRGVLLNCAYCAVINSWIDQIHQVGFDTQAVGGWNSEGPWLIDNNYLEAAGENIFSGGAAINIPNAVPSDITITRNYVYKPTSWFMGMPNYAGTHWSVKNLLELKTGIRVLIEGNIFENNWDDAQSGVALVLKTDASPNNPWAMTSDVTFRYNKVINAKGGFVSISCTTDTNPKYACTQRFHIHDNVAWDIGGIWSGRYSLFVGSAPSGVQPPSDYYLDHNTIITTTKWGVPNANLALDSHPPVAGTPGFFNFAFHNSIIGQNSSYGLFQSCNYGSGTQNFPCTTSDNWHANIFYGSYGGYGPGTGSITYCGGPYVKYTAACPVNDINAVGFTDPLNNNYKLISTSPGYKKGTDGKDVGADTDIVNQMTAGVVSGIWTTGYTPPPQPADTMPPAISGGTPSGSLPIGTIQTTLTVSTNEAATCKYSTTPSVAYTSMTNTFTTTGSYSHSATISGLTNGGSYNYYIRCQDKSSNLNQNTNDYTITFLVAQITNLGRPASDITTGWLGTTVPHWSNLDETVANDADLIRTEFSAGTQTDEVKLSPVLTPSVKTGHILRVRAYTDGTGNTLTYQLVQGTTLIASTTHSLPQWPNWSTDNFTLTTAQASQITNYSDLRVRLIGNALNARILVSWIEFEVPSSSSTQTINGTTPPSSTTTSGSSGSGSGGGGGGGASTTTTQTVQKIYNFIKITPGVTAIVKDFNPEIGINQIKINVTNDAQNVKVVVTKYDGKPAGISVEKSGKVYQYLQINTTNLNGKINKTTVQFRAGKSWASTNGFDKNKIAVYKFDSAAGKWNELQTNLSSEDSLYYYYNVEMGSFSYFAISEKTVVNEKGPVVAEKIGDFVGNLGEGKNLTWLLIFITLVIITLFIFIVLVWHLKKKRTEF